VSLWNGTRNVLRLKNNSSYDNLLNNLNDRLDAGCTELRKNRSKCSVTSALGRTSLAVIVVYPCEIRDCNDLTSIIKPVQVIMSAPRVPRSIILPFPRERDPELDAARIGNKIGIGNCGYLAAIVHKKSSRVRATQLSQRDLFGCKPPNVSAGLM
jgi:hypothetical protein